MIKLTILYGHPTDVTVFDNYFLSSESYPFLDISLMLNNKAPKNKAKIIYQKTMVSRELGITLQPVTGFLNTSILEITITI